MNLDKKTIWAICIIAAVMMLGGAGYLYYQHYAVPRCEACGMIITSEMIDHFHITDSQGMRIYACCQACMLRLLDPVKGYDELHIKTFCDWYGTEYKIDIDATNHGNVIKVVPETARLLLGASVAPGCGNTRIAYNQTAVEMLLIDGYSRNTMTRQRYALPEGTPVVEVPVAATMLSTQVGISYTRPEPWLMITLALMGVAILVGSTIACKNMSGSRAS